MRPLVLVLLVGALTGCTAAPTPAPISTYEPISAETTCTDLSNLLTLLYNSSLSNRDGRMNGQELNGAVLLSDALLDDIDVEPGTGLASEVSILQNLGAEFGVVAARSGADSRPEFGEWRRSIDNVYELCNEDEVMVAVMGWTGG